MNKRKLILLILFSVLLLIAAIGYGAYRWIISSYNLPDDPGKLISLASQMKNFDSEELEQYNPKSQRAIDAIHYQIKLDLFPAEQKIRGEVAILLKINDEKSSAIDINFYDNLNISNITLNGKEAEYSRTEKLLTIERTDTDADSALIKIIYEGTPKSLGFGSFNFKKVDNHYRVYTLSEPVFASTWFPCIDLPDDKALADIFISNDSSSVSVSNGKLMDVKTSGDRRIYHWKTFYPVSTYLIGIYSGNYNSYSQKYVTISGDSLNIVYYASPEKFEDAKRDFSDHPRYIKTFEELFGPYPFVREKYAVAEFGWNAGAMENQTITGIGSDFISGRKFFSDMLIHELAHHWWGNAVGPKTWKDIWLNEGFATYSEALYWEKQSDIRALQSTLSGKSGTFPDGTLYNPGNALFSRLIYNKGAWVLHMLRREVGDEHFFQILREYLRRYKYTNASTRDFREVCEQISKKNLKYFFDQWVFKGEGIIEAEAEWSVKKTDEKFITSITIKQLQKGYDIYKFPIEIKLLSADKEESITANYRVEGREVTLNLESGFKPDRVDFDPESWLLAKFNIITEENQE